jgi:hypothetical protein
LVAVSSNGTEASFHVIRDPEIGRSFKSLAVLARSEDALDREHSDIIAEVAVAERVPPVIDQGRLFRSLL